MLPNLTLLHFTLRKSSPQAVFLLASAGCSTCKQPLLAMLARECQVQAEHGPTSKPAMEAWAPTAVPCCRRVRVRDVTGDLKRLIWAPLTVTWVSAVWAGCTCCTWASCLAGAAHDKVQVPRLGRPKVCIRITTHTHISIFCCSWQTSAHQCVHKQSHTCRSNAHSNQSKAVAVGYTLSAVLPVCCWRRCMHSMGSLQGSRVRATV